MISIELIEIVRNQLRIDWRGIHGMQHWARVYQNGMNLASLNNANVRVVQLFSIFHDSCRISEGSDPGHGPRGAAFALLLQGSLFQLNSTECNQLIEACRFHTSAADHQDLTVKTCFDADRLDLGRVGIHPDPKLLCTPDARKPEIISRAYRQSQNNALPDNVLSSFYIELVSSGSP